MPDTASLLRGSIELAASREALITTRFYAIFHARYPQVIPLFGRNSADAQQRMLQDALLAVLDHLDDSAWLANTMGALGAKHVEYGVTDEMYPWVGECLIATLAELCGDEWTKDHEEAWVAAYGALTGLALAGADRARAAANESAAQA